MLDDPARAAAGPRVPPIGRLIRPEEIAALVMYLLSPAAAAITGQDIQICGGASLGPDMTTADTVGLVGLGLVGRAIAAGLAGGGRRRSWGIDREAQAMQAAALRVAVRRTSAALGSACDCIVLAVFDTAACSRWSKGRTGCSPAGSSRAHLIWTVPPGPLTELAALAGAPAAREASTSSKRRCRARASRSPTAGHGCWSARPGRAARCAAVLAALATQRIHVGGAGMGARAKLATNLVLGLNRAVLCRRHGRSPSGSASAGAISCAGAGQPGAHRRGPGQGAVMVKEEFPPQSRIRQHLKDVDLMLSAAADGLRSAAVAGARGPDARSGCGRRRRARQRGHRATLGRIGLGPDLGNKAVAGFCTKLRCRFVDATSRRARLPAARAALRTSRTVSKLAAGPCLPGSPS